MKPSTQKLQPKIKYKTFTYANQIEWTGNRVGILRSKEKPEFRVASPPEFKGEAGVWSPEDLFVAAVNICTMTTFAAFSQNLNLPIVSYSSNAEGALEFVNGMYRFTKIILRPVILIETPTVIEQTEKTLQDAHKSCIISNSIRATVVIDPRFGIMASN